MLGLVEVAQLTMAFVLKTNVFLQDRRSMLGTNSTIYSATLLAGNRPLISSLGTASWSLTVAIHIPQ